MMVRSPPQYLQTFSLGKINSAQRSQGTRFLSSRGVVEKPLRHQTRRATPNAKPNASKKQEPHMPPYLLSSKSFEGVRSRSHQHPSSYPVGYSKFHNGCGLAFRIAGFTHTISR